jgi:tetratricopeptide (TPR) repeat protein
VPQLTRGRRPFVAIALAVFAIAFGVRLLHVLQIRSTPFFTLLMGDSRSYDEWAVRIAGGDWIGHDVFYQAPLYPYFLGVVYSIAGRHLLIVRLLQAVIGSASCVLLAWAVREIWSEVAGIIAGVMLALWAPAIFFDGLLQKSVLDVFFVCVAIALIVQLAVVSASRRTRTLWLALGVTLGLLALTRENALALIVVALAWTLCHPRRWLAAALVVAGLAVVLLPVALRNRAVGGGFFLTTSQSGPNFYIGNNPKADGTYASLRYGRGSPEYERQDATELAERASGGPLTPAQVSGYWTDRALDFITSSPGAWLQLTARKIALLANRVETVDTESQESYAEYSWPLFLLGPIAHFGLLVPLAVLGVWLAWPLRAPLGVLLALTLAYAASVVVFYVFARYRYPLVPLLIVFASIAIATVAASPRSASAIGWPALTTVAAAALLANWPLLSSALMRAVTESNVGVALQEQRQYDDAIAHYRKAIELRAEYPPAYNNLGTALRAAGRVGEAIETYDRAIQLQPEFPDAEYNLANALFESGRTVDAIAHYQIALRSIPASVEVHTNLGIALAARGSTDDALAEFRAALQADPQSGRAHRNLADLLASQGRTDEAIQHLERAIQIDPNDAAAYYDLGSTLLESGRAQDALHAFGETVRLQPTFAEAHNNLGICFGSIGQLDAAITEFQLALRLKPDLEDARRNLQMALRVRQER